MKRSLFSYEPDTYKKSKVMQNILKQQEQQLEKAVEHQDGVIADMYPSKTVHPELWESEYAITPADTLEQRRKNIVSKMRGAGTAKLQMVKDIVEAYTDGVVTPIENNDDSMINIEIESATASIEDADIMEAQLYEAIPAHIDFHYWFKRPISGQLRMSAVMQTTIERRIGMSTEKMEG